MGIGVSGPHGLLVHQNVGKEAKVAIVNVTNQSHCLEEKVALVKKSKLFLAGLDFVKSVCLIKYNISSNFSWIPNRF